ncbi:hypothetical protein JCM3766R1_005119 [Sporobolomyces carnicolor]
MTPRSDLFSMALPTPGSFGEYHLYSSARSSNEPERSSTFVLPPASPSHSTPPSSAGPLNSESPTSMASFVPYDADAASPQDDAAIEGGHEAKTAHSSRARKSANPPRPPNAWICYRSARVRELKNTSQYSKMPQASISKLIGELWRGESPEVKKKYEDEAASKKLEHQAKYPDYSFRPVRRDTGKKPSLRSADSFKKAKHAELPSVLRPGPPTVSNSLPSPSSAPPSTQSFPTFALPERFELPHSATASSFAPTPSYSTPTDYGVLPSPPSPPAETPRLFHAPIDTSQGWSMFQPVADYLPTPPFDPSSQSRAPSPPRYYVPYESHGPEFIAPSHCISSSSPTTSSSHEPHHFPSQQEYQAPHHDQFATYPSPTS